MKYQELGIIFPKVGQLEENKVEKKKRMIESE
jgi:hypothetical protein